MPEIYIHELAMFEGTPDTGDYIAIDNGTDTNKLDINQIIDPTVIALYQSIGWQPD